MKVCVVNQHGRPLMPTSPRKARLLLKAGKAEIVQRHPFTIRLLYGTRGYTQPVSDPRLEGRGLAEASPC